MPPTTAANCCHAAFGLESRQRVQASSSGVAQQGRAPAPVHGAIVLGAAQKPAQQRRGAPLRAAGNLVASGQSAGATSAASGRRDSYEAFVRANKLAFAPERTLDMLKGLEDKAVIRKNLTVAGQAQNAIWRIEEIQQQVQEWEEDERRAVQAQQYTAAISCVRHAKELIEVFNTIKSQDWGAISLQLGNTEVAVRFALYCPFDKKASYFLVGSVPELGDWSSQDAKQLEYSQGAWRAAIELTPEMPLEFKFLQQRGSDLTWQDGPNRRVKVPALRSYGLDVISRWDGDWQSDLGWTVKPAAQQ